MSWASLATQPDGMLFSLPTCTELPGVILGNLRETAQFCFVLV